jgi:hypothetical protein
MFLSNRKHGFLSRYSASWQVLCSVNWIIVCVAVWSEKDRLCSLVVRVPGCIPSGPGFDSRLYHIFWLALVLERGSFSLRRINKELPEGKRSGSGLKNLDWPSWGFRWPRDTLLSTKLDNKFRRPVAVAQSVEFAYELNAPRFFLLVWE